MKKECRFLYRETPSSKNHPFRATVVPTRTCGTLTLPLRTNATDSLPILLPARSVDPYRIQAQQRSLHIHSTPIHLAFPFTSSPSFPTPAEFLFLWLDCLIRCRWLYNVDLEASNSPLLLCSPVFFRPLLALDFNLDFANESAIFDILTWPDELARPTSLLIPVTR